MGRGRQKAKHTKLARELKSYSPNINYGSLQEELAGGEPNPEVEKWADYAEYDATTGGGSDDEYADDYEEHRSA